MLERDLSPAADSLAGKLLVAPAAMSDPNFANAVTLVLIHNADGAFGLVLDRALDAEVQLPAGWSGGVDAHVWNGGPCETDRLIPLARPKPGLMVSHFQELCPLLGGLGVIDIDVADRDQFDNVRFFLGYAGWAAGQLDWELSVDAWVVADGHPDDPFALDTAGLRSRVLRRVLAARRAPMDFPDDPSSN